jgi:hypothetical protein
VSPDAALSDNLLCGRREARPNRRRTLSRFKIMRGISSWIWSERHARQARLIAHEMSSEREVVKREARGSDLASALLDLSEQEGRAIEIQVLPARIAAVAV